MLCLGEAFRHGAEEPMSPRRALMVLTNARSVSCASAGNCATGGSYADGFVVSQTG